jgi:hypothetical protein
MNSGITPIQSGVRIEGSSAYTAPSFAGIAQKNILSHRVSHD